MSTSEPKVGSTKNKEDAAVVNNLRPKIVIEILNVLNVMA